ncbi:MAG: maleylpyruvate isomerase family mycothiol-dependent enzyme [Actinomycetota bacterium]
MSDTDYIRHLHHECDLFVAAAAGNFDKPVPSCPGWTVRDLVEHMWGVYAWWGLVAERRLQDPADVSEDDEPKIPADEELLDGVVKEVEKLIQAVRHADPSEPIWTWSVNKTMSFIPRRMANESSIHRWDC